MKALAVISTERTESAALSGQNVVPTLPKTSRCARNDVHFGFGSAALDLVVSPYDSARRDFQQLPGVAFEYRLLFYFRTRKRFDFVDALPVAEDVRKVRAKH